MFSLSYQLFPSPAYPFSSCSPSESELSEEDDEEEEEEEDEEEEELELLLLLAFLFTSFPFKALSLRTVRTVRSDGVGAAPGDRVLIGSSEGCLVSDWLAAGDPLEGPSERLESDGGPL